MGMTIDESIDWVEKSILEMRNWQLCTIDKHALRTVIETARKYQKIQEIVSSKTTRLSYEDGFRQIKEVVEDGKND